MATYNYIVTQPGFGYPVGMQITDATLLAQFTTKIPSWVVRVAVPAETPVVSSGTTSSGTASGTTSGTVVSGGTAT